jgi:hypothetical protein
MFNVFYEDGSRRSNRKVPSSALGGIDLDAPALAILEQQDRLIAEKSGNPPRRSKGSADPVANEVPERRIG